MREGLLFGKEEEENIACSNGGNVASREVEMQQLKR